MYKDKPVPIPLEVANKMRRRRRIKEGAKAFGKGVWQGLNLPGLDTAIGMLGPEAEPIAVGLKVLKGVGKPIAALAKARKPARLARQKAREQRREQRLSRKYWRWHPKEAKELGIDPRDYKRIF